MSSLRTVSMSVYSVAVDHEARAPQASPPPAVIRREKHAPTPSLIPVESSAGEASTSPPSSVFLVVGLSISSGCARAGEIVGAPIHRNAHSTAGPRSLDLHAEKRTSLNMKKEMGDVGMMQPTSKRPSVQHGNLWLRISQIGAQHSSFGCQYRQPR